MFLIQNICMTKKIAKGENSESNLLELFAEPQPIFAVCKDKKII